jgi:hypothetical protein
MLNHAGGDDYIARGPIQLAQDDVLRIDDGSGIVIEATEGSLWLTQECGGVDVAIRPPGSYRLDRGGTAIATARGGSVFRLRVPALRRAATRIVVKRGTRAAVVYDARGRRAPLIAALRAWWREHAPLRFAPAGRTQRLAG